MTLPCLALHSVNLRRQVARPVLRGHVAPPDDHADRGLVDARDQLHGRPDDFIQHQARVVLGLRSPREVAQLERQPVIVRRRTGVRGGGLSASVVIGRGHDGEPRT